MPPAVPHNVFHAVTHAPASIERVADHFAGALC